MSTPSLVEKGTYQRYIQSAVFGVIVSPKAGIACDRSGELGFAAAAALEDINIWDLQKGVIAKRLHAEVSADQQLGEVTALDACTGDDGTRMVAAGTTTGAVRLFRIDTGENTTTFSGHRSGVNVVRYARGGSLLASGGQNGDVVVWDVVAERGLYRLRGHRDAATDLAFVYSDMDVGISETPRVLLSSSKDSTIKAWDLETQHCVQTLMGHRSEVWSIDIDDRCRRLVSGASDREVRLWSLHMERLADAVSSEDGLAGSIEIASSLGSVTRQSNDRCQSVRFMRFPSSGGEGVVLLGCLAASKVLEMFRLRPEAEAGKRLKRRLKRRREKSRQNTIEEAAVEESQERIASDELEPFAVVRSNHKIRSFAFSLPPRARATMPSGATDAEASIVLALHNNALEVHTLPTTREASPDTLVPRRVSAIEMAGHRSGVRAVAISSDDKMLATVSSTSLKIWSADSRECRSSATCGYGLCAAFAPGDRHVLLGTKEGSLQIFELASADASVSEENAHSGSIWTLDVRPDGRGFASGGADNLVKFWDFELRERQLGIVHTRTLKMTDDVLSLRFSRGGAAHKLLLAVATLDGTIKVFHDDTLKFFLSLYGHKLPVLALDISDDNTLIATGSADKTLKLWGLDFGDCHRSILAHEDSVTAVRFVARSHYVFTASKDKTIKFWDADRFEQILRLEGHSAEVWALAISRDGRFLLSGGHDRSLRLWERTDEMVFLEEERERELEAMFEQEVDEKESRPSAAGAMGTDAALDESAAASCRTLASVKAGERLIEALEIAAAEEKVLAAQSGAASRRQNPMLLGLPPLRYILRALHMIKGPELEQALLILPLHLVELLCNYLVRLLRGGVDVELCSRCAIFMMRVHQAQIVAHHAMFKPIQHLQQVLRGQLTAQRDMVGKNLAGLRFLKRQKLMHQ